MKRAWFLSLCVIAVSGSASAQISEEGRISTRSDVKMSVEGTLGTGGSKLDALVKTLSKPLGDVKQCYGELVKTRPDVVGTLVVELDVPEGKGAPKVRTPNATKELKLMDRCVNKAFGKLDVSEVPRPAGARITLELTNTAAASVSEVRDREEEASKVEVTQTPDGAYQSEGRSTQGEILFRVTARGKGGSATVERVHQAIREALPSLFDCRRRAGKNGSPGGDLVFNVQLRPSERANVELSSTTVEAQRAPYCVDSALTQALGKGRGRAQVTITFAP